MAVESHGFNEVLRNAEWVDTWIGLCNYLNFHLKKRDILNREIKVKSIPIKKGDCDLNMVCITDAESLFDNFVHQLFWCSKTDA